MGYLDHSTNNIILDAVLTDYGRQRLSSANSAFNIASYSLADDEVDYRIIKKFGRAIGKEKIEKNTCIFEAHTNANTALKYKLIGRENDGGSVSTVFLPILSLTSVAPNLNKSKNDTITFSLTLNNLSGAALPSDYIQPIYTIKVSDRFFTLTANAGGALTYPDIARNIVSSGDPNRTAVYKLSANNGASANYSFNVIAKNIDNTTLSIYGKPTATANQRVITSYITITGERHGCILDIPITYTASLS